MPRFERSALPNIITVARIIVAPIVFFLVFVRGFWPGVITFTLYLVAAISDLWDGHLARKHGWISDFGKLWDPVADKLLVIATFIPFYILSHRPDGTGALPIIGPLPLWVVIVIFGREVVITFIRSLAAGRGLVIPAGKSGKHKAVFQNIFCASTLAWYAVQDGVVQYDWSGWFWNLWVWFHTVVVLVSLSVAVVLTLWSMGVYLWHWRRLMRTMV